MKNLILTMIGSVLVYLAGADAGFSWYFSMPGGALLGYVAANQHDN